MIVIVDINPTIQKPTNHNSSKTKSNKNRDEHMINKKKEYTVLATYVVPAMFFTQAKSGIQ